MKYTNRLSRVKKGQFLSILVVVTLLFISGGSMFTTLFANHEMNRAWSVFTGDMRTLAETQMKAESYPQFLNEQARFSTNNAGYELGRNGAHKTWNNTNMPSKDVLEQQFIDTVITNTDYGLKANNKYAGCSVPNIGDYGYGYSVSGKKIAFDLDGNTIVCGGKNRGIQELQFISQTSYNEAVSIRHNYLDASRYAVELAHALEQALQDGPIYGVASDTTVCYPNSTEEEQTINSAKESSEQNARDKIDGTAQDAVDDVTQPQYLEVETNEWSSWWPPQKVNQTQKDCSITHSHSNSTCTFNDCVFDGQADHIYYEVDNACNDLDEDETCVGHTHDTESDSHVYKIKFKYNTTLADYFATVNITDTQDQVLTHEGLKNIPFDYRYKDDIVDN